MNPSKKLIVPIQTYIRKLVSDFAGSRDNGAADCVFHLLYKGIHVL